MELEFDSFDELKKTVVANGNVLTVQMEKLRDAQGVRRIGRYVVANIHNQLQNVGLGHFPEPLPLTSEASVRIYSLGTPIADLISALLVPGNANDDKLRSAAAGQDATLIDQIRALVCD